MFFLVLLALLAVFAIAATIVQVRSDGYGSAATRCGRSFDEPDRRDSRW